MFPFAFLINPEPECRIVGVSPFSVNLVSLGVKGADFG